MSPLDQYLRFLERPDVRELVLQTNSPAQVRLGDELKPLTRQAFTPAHLEALLAGTVLADLLADADASGTTTIVQVSERSYAVRVARFGDRWQVRIARGVAGDRRDGQGGGTASLEDAPDAKQPATGIELDLETTIISDSQARDTSDFFPTRADEPVQVASRSTPRLAELLKRARAAGASDLHLMAGRPCRVRIHGQLRAEATPLSEAQVRDMLEPLLDQDGQRLLESVGYVDFGVEIPGAGRMRVNVCRQRTGLKGCFRLVAPRPPALGELGLPNELAQITRHHQGLVIVSGPNGHGKTTTLAALVHVLNESKPIHIISVEDPVEVVHPRRRALVTQREVGRHTRSFQTALKAALREDPDVIAIGELRDRETVEMALSASETGHLVIATMSTPSGARTIDRLIDMFPPDDQAQVRATLAGALKLIVSQRLLPRSDDRGMVAAAELITGGIPLWSLIRDNKLYQLESLLQRGRAFGMIRIEDSLNQLYREGLITQETARGAAGDPRLLAFEAARAAPAPELNLGDHQKAAGRRGLFGRKG